MNGWDAYWCDFPGMPEALEKVSRIIRESAASDNPVISQGLGSLFDGGGKLLRPGLLLIAAGFGKLQEKHYTLAACLEMLHMATLIHDDVIDESPTRRGRPALHCCCGNRSAVLTGDFLLSRCFTLAAKYTSPENALVLAQAVAVICDQEIEQNSGRYCGDFSLRRYFRKIMGKSAVLFALACSVGASEAKAPKPLISRLRRVGYNIGMAFQIIDDILDYSGDPDQAGKPLGNDIREGLVTLPLICALPLDASGTLRQLLPAGDSNAIIRAVRESGGIRAARAYAEAYTQRALRELAALPACLPRDMLDMLTRRLLLRNA